MTPRTLLFGLALLFAASAAYAESLEFEVPVRMDGSDKPRVLHATKGDRIAINWSADKPVVVHIHPYDIEQEVAPGKPAKSEFDADIAGRFPIEAHPATKKGHKVIAYLEVLPR